MQSVFGGSLMKKGKHAPLSAAREIRLSFTLAAIVYLALGLLLLFAPNTSRTLLCTLVGAGISLYGLFNILSYLLDKGASSYTLELLIGVCALAFGVFSLIRPVLLMDMLFMALGIVIIVTSISGLKRALNLRAFGFEKWWLTLLVSCLTMLLALSIVLAPGLYGDMLMMVIGLVLIAESVCDLFSIHRLSSHARRAKAVHTLQK